VTAVVFVQEEPPSDARHELDGDATIGREGCDVLIDDPIVSRRHAAIRMTNEGAIVEDLGSTHGTFVNNQRVTGRQQLLEGDRIQFGSVVWRVVSGVPAPAAAPTTAPPPKGNMRGDVPEPERVPSAVRAALPAAAPSQPFRPPGRQPKVRGSAARRVEATVVSYGVVIATAVALGVYFAQR
jgi:predicted component of type VI protein secretion system